MRFRWPWILLCVALTGDMLHKLCVQMMRLDGDLSVYYHSSNELVSGISPYYPGTHYIYPPLFAWLIAPLAQLPPVGYAIAWGLLLGACWLISIHFVRRLTGDHGALTVALPSLILFRAIWNGWGHGQLSLLMSAMVLAFLVLERERKLVAATFWLAFAGALKVFPFYLGVLLLAPGNLIAIPMLALWTIFLSALPALTVGLHQLKSLICDGFLGYGMARINSEHGLIVNHAPVPHFFQLFAIESHGLLRAANAACLLVVTAAVVWARPARGDRARDNLYLSFALTSCLMVCPHVWLHYFTLLLLPFSVLLMEIRDRKGSLDAAVLTIGLAVAGVAFNTGSKFMFSDAMSARCDEVGIPSLGLLALWGALAFVMLRPELSEAAAPLPDVSLA